MDIYLRNAHKYVETMQNFGYRRYVWSYGEIERRRMDPVKWVRLHEAGRDDWEILVIAIEGALYYTSRSKDMYDPIAVYPVWNTDMDTPALKFYCTFPMSEIPGMTTATGTINSTHADQFRPVKGQAHKIVIFAPPDISTKAGREMFADMRRIRDEHPDVEWIVYNTTSYRVIFSGMFQGVGFDAFIKAKSHMLHMPPGKNIVIGDRFEWSMWFDHLGYDMNEVWETLESRVSFNLDSLRWAESNFERIARFRLRVMEDVDIDSPDVDVLDAEYSAGHWFRPSGRRRTLQMLPEDGNVCDECSLAPMCKVYREGAVCAVAGTDGAELAKLFGSRDSNKIIDGLSELVKIQSERVAEDVNLEERTDERHIETDRRLKDLFEAGVKLAKLIDPSLTGNKGTVVNVGIMGANGQTVIAQSTPQEIVAKAVRALESAGVDRSEITQETIAAVINGENPELIAASKMRVIEGVPSALPGIVF